MISTRARKLLMRDLILNKRMILIYLAMATVFFILYPYFVQEAGVIVGFAGAWLGFIPASLLGREHKFRSLTVSCSLPVTRREVVGVGVICILASYYVSVALFKRKEL